MALPCFCYRCGIYKSQQSLIDEECLSVEMKNICDNSDCDNCSYTCERFTESLDKKKTGIYPAFVADEL